MIKIKANYYIETINKNIKQTQKEKNLMFLFILFFFGLLFVSLFCFETFRLKKIQTSRSHSGNS
jgi:hypothetical protein